jgi:glycosyltransferase involved in cell wall biosynthesis
MPNEIAPVVSIITPTFNHERFIGPCIESVLKQTYVNWEQIIIDDGSSDRTADVIRGYSDSRIRYVYQENRGIEALPHLYNRALSMCRGDLIAILEGDDLWPPNKLSAQVRVFQDEGVVLAYGAVADIGADGHWCGRLGRSVRKRMRFPLEILLNDPPGSATRYMLRADGLDLVPPSTAVVRRSALTSISGFQYVPGLCVTDFPTFVTLSLVGKFYYTPQVMGYRRRHLGSATYNNFVQILTHAHKYASQFIAEHSLSMNRAEHDAIKKTWNGPRPSLEFTAGRLELLNGQWRVARAHFVRALNLSVPDIFVASLLGWSLSWLRCNLERFLTLTGVASLEEARLHQHRR